MGNIRAAIALYDGVTSPLQSMHKAMGVVLNTFEAMQQASGRAVDTAAIREAREEWARAGTAFDTIEENIRNANNEQQNFNNSIRGGSNSANGLLSIIKKVAIAAGGIAGINKALNISDELASTKARLNLLVDDGGSVEALEQKIMASAQRSRSVYFDTASAVAKLGLNAGNAFGGNMDQVIAFMEQVNKQFVIGGANSTIQFPVVEEGARLTLERKGTPGKLEFTVVKGPGLNFAEGDPVKLTVNGTAMFYGFVFKKKRDKGGTIDVVAYDQLRYLKNKDTITEEGLKASDLLKRIATDFRLNLGTVEDTGYTLETIVEENQTLFDMIQSALDETLMNTKQLYVLYDDAGKLTLKNINTMKLNLLIDEETGENFSYESSIDEQTYNKIKLAYNDEKTGKRELFIAQDGAKMNQWGVLQYFEEVQTKTGASAKADALLKLYDQKTRKLTIQNAFGDVRVRAGSAVVVALNLGDIVTNNYMVVNKVTHTFRGDEHMMELDLIGGEFIA